MNRVLSATWVQTYARVVGVLFLLSVVAGGFGEAYVPSTLIVSGDAAATAKNIHDFNFLFRLGFAVYLVGAVCAVALSLLFSALVRPVHRDVALPSALSGLTSTHR